jgi:hypothetical protein
MAGLGNHSGYAHSFVLKQHTLQLGEVGSPTSEF